MFGVMAGISDTAARAIVVINKSGKIVCVEQTPKPEDLPDFQAIKAALLTAK
jgi:glutaredoxin-dependent peroxiredoxin